MNRPRLQYLLDLQESGLAEKFPLPIKILELKWALASLNTWSGLFRSVGVAALSNENELTPCRSTVRSVLSSY